MGFAKYRETHNPTAMPNEEPLLSAAVAEAQPVQLEELTELIRQRLLSALYLGSMKAGARLPSLRQLAQQYAVDIRLVRRAYQLLEHEGLVELRSRSGVFFAPAAERSRAPLSPRAQWLINVAVDGLSRGISVPDLGQRVEQYTDASDLRIACIECNDDQCAALCREISRSFGATAVQHEIDELLASQHVARDLAAFDLLVTTPFHAGEVEELAGRVGKPWLCMPTRSDIFSEIAKQLPATDVYYAVCDKRFAEKLHRIFANTAHGSRLKTLIAGDDDVTRLSSGAPLYLTALAREALGSAVPASARPSVCLFSPAASRGIMAFIVARNIERADRRG